MGIDELEGTDALGDIARDAAKVLAPLALLIFGPVILLLAAFGGRTGLAP